MTPPTSSSTNGWCIPPSSRARPPSSPTGSQCLPAVGCAEAIRYIQGRTLEGCSAHGDELTYVSLGEGATSEGEFWESLNTACRLHLPVLFVVADNGYAISVRSEDQSPAPISEMVRGFRGLAVTTVDGRDYLQCRHLGARAVSRVRAAEGPGLIHAQVTRPYSHSAADTQSRYRSAAELDEELAHDPDSAGDLFPQGDPHRLTTCLADRLSEPPRIVQRPPSSPCEAPARCAPRPSAPPPRGADGRRRFRRTRGPAGGRDPPEPSSSWPVRAAPPGRPPPRNEASPGEDGDQERVALVVPMRADAAPRPR